MKTRALLSLSAIIAIGGCTMNRQSQDGPPDHYVDVSTIPNAKPHYLAKSRFANPASYTVNHKTYRTLKSNNGYHQRGIASWYGTKFNGQLTSSGEPYNMLAMTAASKVLRIPTFVKVTNLQNGKQVIVKVNDRGPFAPNRIIDLSYVAAKKLDMIKNGTALVEVSAIDVSHPGSLHPLPVHHQPKLYLQVGAFKQFANAKQVERRLQQFTHKPIHITQANLNHHPLYRVQVGPLIGVNETDQLKSQFERQGFNHTLTVIS